MATIRLIIIAKEMVKPNCFKYCPTVPRKNEIGVKPPKILELLVENYDKSKELILDPVLNFATFTGIYSTVEGCKTALENFPSDQRFYYCKKVSMSPGDANPGRDEIRLR